MPVTRKTASTVSLPQATYTRPPGEVDQDAGAALGVKAQQGSAEQVGLVDIGIAGN